MPSSNRPVQTPGLGLLDSREARADLPRRLLVRPQVRGWVRAVIRMRPRSPDCREARAVQQSNPPLAQPRRRSREAGSAVPTFTRWYERRAKDCVRAGGRTDDLRHRERLLRLAYEWALAAQEQAS